MTSHPSGTSRGVSGGIGRRGFLGAAAALGGTAALAPVAAAAPLDRSAAAPAKSAAVAAKPSPNGSLPPSAVSLVPISDGAVTAAIARLDRIIKDVIARTGVPGLAAAVVHNDQLKFAKAYGVRNLRTGEPVTTDTVFQLASLSKPLAATVVARVVEKYAEKGVDWANTIVSRLPSFALSDPYVGTHVTIEDMLSHRSGLPGGAGDLLEDLGYDRAYVIDRLRLEPLTPMRTKYAYANFGYTTGAMAAAAVANKTWGDLAAAELFEPLGMTQSSYREADFLNRPNHTAMHVRVDGVWQQLYTRNAQPEAPAGGATSTVLDLSIWLRMQLANGVSAGKVFLQPTTLGTVRTPKILLSPPSVSYARTSFYGLGMDISDDAAARVRWSHSGAFFQGASTAILMLPSANLGIVVLTNGMPIGVPESIGAYFLDDVEAGKATRDWLTGYGAQFAAIMANNSELAGKTPPANPTPAHPDPFYSGTYLNDFHGPILVQRMPDGLLHLFIGPELKNDYVLTHWDGDVFSFFPTGENAVGITAATFTPNGAGTQAASVTLEYYNVQGLGVFTR